jgi:hypothetical protein
MKFKNFLEYGKLLVFSLSLLFRALSLRDPITFNEEKKEKEKL